MISALKIEDLKIKPEELSIFSNVAYEKVLNLLKLWAPKGKTYNKLREINDLPDSTCVKLRDYIYKDYLREKNSSGNVLTPEEKEVLPEILRILEHIRNYYSHFVHIDLYLHLSHNLKKKLTTLINESFSKYSQSANTEHKDVQDWLYKNPFFTENSIQEQDAIFFVSLFLMKSEGVKLVRYWLRKKSDPTIPESTRDKLVKALTFHCHRDGATRKYYNHKEANLFERGIDQLNEVLAARTFYKINDYLAGVPPHLYDPRLYPLYLKKGAESKAAISKEDYITYFNALKIEVSSDELKTDAGKPQKHVVNRIELLPTSKSEPKGNISFKLSDKDDYHFAIRINQFHKFILELFLHGEETIKALTEIIQYRSDVHSILSPELKWTQRIIEYENTIRKPDFYRNKTYADPSFIAKYNDWVELGKLKMNPPSKTLYDILQQSPIIIRLNDILSLTKRQKVRSKDRFMSFAVQYLIEFDKLPGWKWAFEPVNRGAMSIEINGHVRNKQYKLEYYSDWPHYGKMRSIINAEDPLDKDMLYTLHLSKDQHVLLKHDDFPDQVFSIGQNVMRILLLKIKEGGKNHHHFLRDLAGELAAYRAGSPNTTIRYLKDQYIPTVLKTKGEITPIESNDRAVKRIEYIEKKLQHRRELLPQRPRAQVNRWIMDMYTLYDWKPKFQRKNEYNNFSIYHYSLEKIRWTQAQLKGEPNIAEQYLLKKDLEYFDKLICEGESGNKFRGPRKVQEQLYKALNLDDLFLKMADATFVLLKEWKENLQTADPEIRRDIRAKLGFRSESKKDAGVSSHLPYIIHPGQILEYYYPGNSITSININQAIYRNPKELEHLKTIPYLSQGYEKYAKLMNTFSKPLERKIIGACNKNIVLDALLWWMAKQYYTQKCERLEGLNFLPKDAQKGTIPEIGSLQAATIDINVSKTRPGENRIPDVRIRMHQLDDAIFVETASRLEALTKYFVFSLSHDHIELEHVDFDELMKTWGTIQNDALRIAHQINEMESTHCIARKESIHSRHGHEEYVKFDKVMQLEPVRPESPEALISLRKNVMHMGIPVDTNYKSWITKEEIVDFLGEFDLKPKAKRQSPKKIGNAGKRPHPGNDQTRNFGVKKKR